MKGMRKNLVMGGILLAAVAAYAILFLVRLSQPDEAQTELYLGCTKEDTGGWSFFTESGSAEPIFGFGGYLEGIQTSGNGPVAAERILEDPGERSFLQFSCYDIGIQVFLDDTLLYTDFPGEENLADAFLQDVDPTGIAYDGLRVPLPEDCEGKRLRIVTYGSAVDGLRPVVFPSLTGRFSDAVIQTTGVVWPMAAVTAHLLLAIGLCVVLLLGIQEGEAIWKLLPLGGYFLLAVFSDIRTTYLESSAGLSADSGSLRFLYLIQMDLLYGYLACELRGRKRWILFAGTLLHMLLCGCKSFFGITVLSETALDWLGFALLLLALGFCFRFDKTLLRRISQGLCILTLLLLLLWKITRYTGVGLLYPLTNPVTALLQGSPHAFYALFCDSIGLLCAFGTLTEFLHHVMLRQREVQAMRLKGQTIREAYEQTRERLRQTALFRHEWKNHVAALSILAGKGDYEEIQAYLKRLDGALEQLSPVTYTLNPTVNTILQRFAAKAEQQGIAFRIDAMLPEKLELAQEDLCGFLFNMLDNAFAAAAQTQPGEVLCSLKIRQQYLAIRCENTYQGALRLDVNGELLTSKDDTSEHGFGLKRMQAIAEKYEGMLDISYDGTRFTVMTALKRIPKK